MICPECKGTGEHSLGFFMSADANDEWFHKEMVEPCRRCKGDGAVEAKNKELSVENKEMNFDYAKK